VKLIKLQAKYSNVTVLNQAANAIFRHKKKQPELIRCQIPTILVVCSRK